MIDLSKLKALELPSREIEVEILGEKQKTTVSSLPDRAAVKVSAMQEMKGDDPDLTTLVIREILASGAKELTAEEIDLLIDRDFPAAAEIAAAIRDLTAEHRQKIADVREQAKKNLKAAELVNGKD